MFFLQEDDRVTQEVIIVLYGPFAFCSETRQKNRATFALLDFSPASVPQIGRPEFQMTLLLLVAWWWCYWESTASILFHYTMY